MKIQNRKGLSVKSIFHESLKESRDSKLNKFTAGQFDYQSHCHEHHHPKMQTASRYHSQLLDQYDHGT